MSVVVAQSHYIFGLRSKVANNICYFDEQTVIFPSGNNCVKYNVDQKWQKFIPGSEKSQGMQALAISPNRRYLAMSEKASDKATITIYDLASMPFKKRKVLSATDFTAHEFVSIAFSPDSKYLVALSGSPEWQIIFWMWEKQNVMATVRADSQNSPIYQVSFNPHDNSQICVTGHGVFKIFRYMDGNLKQINFQKVEAQNFLSHAWLSEDRVICGTDTGKLCLWEQHQHSDKRQASSEDGRTLSVVDSTMSSPAPINSILAYSKGFLCCGGPGTVCMFEKVEDQELYKKGRNITIPQDKNSNDAGLSEKQEVLCMCLSPSEETVIISTDKGQLYSIALSSADITKSDDVHFDFLAEPWHSSAITGLSVCIRKPLIATCSLDHSVRIWNYENKY